MVALFRGDDLDGHSGHSAPLHYEQVHGDGDGRMSTESVGLQTRRRPLRLGGDGLPAAIHPETESGQRRATRIEVEMSPARGRTTGEHEWSEESSTALMRSEGKVIIAAVDARDRASFGLPSPSPTRVGAVVAEKGERDVQDVLNAFGNGRYQLLVFCVCGLAWSADGCLLTALPLSMPILEEQWALSPVSQAVLLSSVGLGQTIGALVLGALSDRLGRRATLASAEVLCVLFAAASFFARGFWSLLACQLLTGCAVGGSIPVAFSLLVESLADAHKDRVLCLMQVWFKAGVVLDILLGWVLVKSGWRVLMLASGIPPLIVLFPLLCLVEESPVHLRNQGNLAEATKALEKIGRWNSSKRVSDSADAILTSAAMDEQDENMSIIEEDAANPEFPPRDQDEAEASAVATSQGPPPSSADNPRLREYAAIVLQKVTIRTALMWLAINLGSGLYLWYPAIATHMGAGTVGEFGGSLVANLIGIVAFVLAAFSTARVGHARLLVGSCLACAIASADMSFGIGTGSVTTMVAGYVTWMFFFDIAWPVIYAVSPRLFDAKTRTTAFGFASGVGKLGVLISPWFRVATGSNLGDSSEYLVLVYGLFWVVTGHLAFQLRQFMPAGAEGRRSS